MGFLSKLMKNPLVQMALPMALTAAAGPAFGALGAKFPLFANMNPLMANALKQTALGYGTAALSGSRRPGKAAMVAGLTSIPFSYMSAANAAKAFNEQYGGMQGMEKFVKTPGRAAYTTSVPGAAGMTRYIPEVAPVMGFEKMAESTPRITPMEILTGKREPITLPPQLRTEDFAFEGSQMSPDPKNIGKNIYQDIVPGETIDFPDADIFSKPVKEKIKIGEDVFMSPTGEYKTDFLPTAVSQAAGLYAGRDTPEEEFQAAKRRRIKELAFMYGVDPSMIEGEMDNPFYTGAFMNSGGIASLNMDMGGNVSGPGGPKDDMIDAKLSDGEFVMTAKAVENFGNGDRYQGARKMYDMMNMLDPESETMSEVV